MTSCVPDCPTYKKLIGHPNSSTKFFLGPTLPLTHKIKTSQNFLWNVKSFEWMLEDATENEPGTMDPLGFSQFYGYAIKPPKLLQHTPKLLHALPETIVCFFRHPEIIAPPETIE